jgi:hypothetical protein
MWMEARLLDELLNGVDPMISAGGRDQKGDANKENRGRDGK